MKIFSSIGKARIMTVLVAIVAFFLFRSTMHEGFFPGESARQAAIAMQLEPGIVSLQTTQVEKRTIAPITGGQRTAVNSTSVTTDVVHFRTKHVAWRLVSTIVAALPIGQISISDRLNGFCVLLGALCVAFAFSLGRGLTLFLSFHATPLSAKNRKRAAFCAGFTGAVMLATSMPFWIASTRCSPYPFEILLLLGMGYALFRAAIGHRTFPLLVFGILFGISIFEWQVGLFLAPVFLFFAFRAMLVGEVNDAYGVTNVLVGFAIGLLGYLFTSHFFLMKEGVSFMLAFREILFSLKYGGGLLFRGGTFESNPLLVSLCFAVLPFLAMIAMAIWRSNDSASSSSGLLLFALACTFSVCAIDIPISPWGASRVLTTHTLPVTSYLFNAAVAAYLAGQGALMSGGHFIAISNKRKRQTDGDDEGNLDDEHKDSPVGRILLWYVTIFAVCMAFWNSAKIHDWHDSFLDNVATLAAQDFGERSWILKKSSNLDSLLRIHARLLNKRVVVLDPADERAIPLFKTAMGMKAPAFKDLSSDNIDKLRNMLATTNATLFVSKWISIDPMIGSKLEVPVPDDITIAGKEAVPSLLGFHAEVKDTLTDWEALADLHLSLWAKLADVPPLGHDAPFWLRTGRAETRNQIVRAGRYLEAKLVKESHLEKAQKVRAAVDAIAEEPIVAMGPADYHPLY